MDWSKSNYRQYGLRGKQISRTVYSQQMSTSLSLEILDTTGTADNTLGEGHNYVMTRFRNLNFSPFRFSLQLVQTVSWPAIASLLYKFWLLSISLSTAFLSLLSQLS